MPWSITLDTNILLRLTAHDEKIAQLRNEYNFIQKTNTALTKWQYLVLTENELTSSPLTIWEYTSVKIREQIQDQNIEEVNLDKLLAKVLLMDEKYNKKQPINKMTLAVALLFADATGVPCDDAYHFIHAARNNADIFATENKKHFSMLRKMERDDIIANMTKILKMRQPLECLTTDEIQQEIDRISRAKWPTIVYEPAEIPL
jgi:predicted nucleic acid-binding protein